MPSLESIEITEVNENVETTRNQLHGSKLKDQKRAKTKLIDNLFCLTVEKNRFQFDQFEIVMSYPEVDNENDCGSK